MMIVYYVFYYYSLVFQFLLFSIRIHTRRPSGRAEECSCNSNSNRITTRKIYTYILYKYAVVKQLRRHLPDFRFPLEENNNNNSE